MGLGTAHKLSLIYAIKNEYEFLVTMDADFPMIQCSCQNY